MATGVAHLTIDVLSAYLDRELTEREVTAVEAHVEACSECRVQLESLGRVVGRLRSLERMAPPQLLEMDVQRRIALAAPEDGLLGKMDGRLGRLPVQPGILVTFALIFCFAAILFTFAQGLEDRHARTIPIVLIPSPPSSPSISSAETGGRVSTAAVNRWEWSGEAWQLMPWGGVEGVAGADFEVDFKVDPEVTEVSLGSVEWELLLAEWPELQSLEVGAIEESLVAAEVRILLPDRTSVRIVEAESSLED